MLCIDCNGILRETIEGYACENCGQRYVQTEFQWEVPMSTNISPSQAKGLEGQQEFVKLFGGEGATDSNDVYLPNSWTAGVKRFKDGEKTLYGWLEHSSKPEFVAFRADNKPWIAAIAAPRLKLLTDIQMAARDLMDYTEDGLPNPSFFEEYQASAAKLERLLAQVVRQGGTADV